ncbi:polysaccharide biosynthesis protein [Thermus thermamylovorans]|uniref:Polysaccharide biosynthesis protein n=1 Tax=Thermus thermamylovorans TaxID=2509362 RepID=A0A4Q9B9A4_9DEIN|nr:nucleoside-diphosphate sugar epimerase/dehydratase [Thermus thermamylovorans]TBH21918.1 polysaccharide biosynthesis protein [Thermus thermamylovorans]
MRTTIKFLLDLLLWALATPLAFTLRLEGLPPQYREVALVYALLGLPVKALLVYFFGLHLQAWSRVGVRDLLRLLKAVVLGTAVLLLFAWLLAAYLPVPKSVPPIAGVLALLAMGGARLATRLYWENRRGQGTTGRRVLVAGAGEAGSLIAGEMLRHPEAGLRPVGFLDDDPNKRGQTIKGVPVVGSLQDLPKAVRELAVEEVLIAMPSAPGSVVRQVVNLARLSRVPYRILPPLYEILSGRVGLPQIREVRLEDLLRRRPVRLNLEEIAGYLEGRVVLITGAGGSIGSEVSRQVARFHPDLLLLLGRGENSLFQLEKELEVEWPELRYKVVVADVRHREGLEQVFRLYRPHVVFHAAAHKHVPLMEAWPSEAVFNNVGGTRNLVELALVYGVERLVNISTDKAVNPTSVMGASKRVAEMVVSWGAKRAKEGQDFVSVRFGNVLGSRGSVVPLFLEQIRRGGPVTVTHPEMRRYFMTIPEATQLVLQAGSMGGRGLVYVLDMGEPVRILDLAKDLIRLAGLEPYRDIEIVFTGMRPGEKLYEELLTAEEGTEASRHEKIFVAKNGTLGEDFPGLLEGLFAAARSYDPGKVREALSLLVPSYSPGSWEALPVSESKTDSG